MNFKTYRGQLFLVFVLLIISGCAKQPSGWGQSPCDLELGDLGDQVSVSGIVEFVDDTEPGILYADLEAGGCRVGMTATTGSFNKWNSEQKSAFEVGADITVSGFLFSAPLPDRPDEMQLIVELLIPPEVHQKGDPAAGEQHQPPGELCRLDAEIGSNITAAGELTFMDATTAAGIYAEMRSGTGCYYKLWVERRFWDQWEDLGREAFSLGNDIQVEGLLTLVLGEQTIDLADPPAAFGP